jgi:RNA polymerase sigma-70 factor (ECF subfamily)
MSTALRKTAELSDGEMIAQITRGQLDGLGALFERYEPLVRRYLGRLGVSASDADDLVQASFLEVIRAAPRFDPRYPVRNWLLGITSVMARRHQRSLARTARRIAAWAGIGRTELMAHGPAETLEGEAAQRAVARGLAALSPKKREAFVLVTLEGLSGEQAAATLGIPLRTVWTRLHHARRELRAALAEVTP